MDNEFYELVKWGLQDDLRTWGEPFTYNGTTYQGIINMMNKGSQLIEGGLLEVFTTVIVVAKKDLPTAPVAGQTLFIGTQQARIEQVGSDEISWELHCVTAAR